MSKVPQHLPWNELFTYSEGVLNWLGRRGNSKAGRTRGHADVLVNGKRIKVHRIIYEMHHGPIPEGMQIDHINGNPEDNRVENLRVCTHKQNARNSRLSKRSTTGYKGVYFLKAKNKYAAHITVDRKRKHLGYYKTPELAHAAYADAADKSFGEFAKHY